MLTLLVCHHLQAMEILYGLMMIQLNSSNISTLANNLTEIETNIVDFGNKVSTDTISKYNELKVEFDNNKFIQSITNIQFSDACVDRWRGLRENHMLMMKSYKLYNSYIIRK